MDLILKNQTSSNQRKAIRFIRKDIKVSVLRINFFGFKETINCKLLDISSSGAQLSTNRSLNKNIPINLKLNFSTENEFIVSAKVVQLTIKEDYLSIHKFPTIHNLLKNNEVNLESLDLYESNDKIIAKYRNLCSDNVEILTFSPLSNKKQHTLLFNLSNGENYKTDTEINYNKHRKYKNYGIKFDRPNDELGEYLIETQTDLVFK